MPARIGLFGGAFDPPHDAHLALAQAAVSELRLDELLVLPTGDAWHKSRPLSPARGRLAMARLAFDPLPRVTVDDRELRRDGPTYTIDTLLELQAEYPGATLWLQIGADQAASFRTWRRVDEILRIANISIAIRPDAAPTSGQFEPQDPLPGLKPDLARIHLLALPAMPHSSTDIRRRVAAGEPIDHLVPAPVARYIEQHHLYQPPS